MEDAESKNHEENCHYEVRKAKATPRALAVSPHPLKGILVVTQGIIRVEATPTQGVVRCEATPPHYAGESTPSLCGKPTSLPLGPHPFIMNHNTVRIMCVLL